MRVLIWVAGDVEPIVADFGDLGGFSPWTGRRPITGHIQTNGHSRSELSSSFDLTRVFLECGKKMQYIKKTKKHGEKHVKLLTDLSPNLTTVRQTQSIRVVVVNPKVCFFPRLISKLE